jgi:hypothetical protein
MGTLGSTSFAMQQKHLPPSAQLALIMIADGCSEFFNLDEAAERVTNSTRVDTERARRIVRWLVKYQFIQPYPFAKDNVYFVPELFKPSFPDMAQVSRARVVDNSGYVYLLQSPTSAYKIGKTGNPDSRFATFKTALPFEVEYVCVIKTDDMHSLEKELHKQFADKRVNGEWFVLSPNDVEFIKGLAK